MQANKLKENGLNEAIESIAHISQIILTNTQEVHSLANESLKDAQNSYRSTETQLGSIEEIAAASKSLADLSEQLQNVISHFKLSIEKVKRHTRFTFFVTSPPSNMPIHLK